MKKCLLLPLYFLMCCFAPNITAQDCSADGNVAIFSNYEGGELIIDVNQNIPDLKIGIAAYEPTNVTFVGAFVANITQVIYVGYQPSQPGNNSCGTVNLVSVQSPPNAAAVVFDTPPVTLNSPDIELFPGFFLPVGDNSGITGCSTCINDEYQGGSNTSEQVIDYFMTQFGGDLLFLKTQYSCWCGTQDLNQPPTCCFEQSIEENVFIQATPSLSLCDGDITLDAGPGYDFYSWSSGQNSQSITVTAAGFYSVTVNSECGQANDEVFVEACAEEFQVLLTDQTVCEGEDVVFSAELMGGTAPFDFQWTPNFGIGPGPFTTVFTENSTIDVVVIDATGLSATASATITVEGQPFLDLGPDQNLCDDFVLLTSPLSEGSIVWSTSETGSQITVFAAGTYSATLTNSCGQAFDEVVISDCPEELEVSLTGGSICPGEVYELMANAVGGVQPYTYTWTPAFSNSPGPFGVSPTSTATYSVTVVDAAGISATATAEIIAIEENLAIDLGPNQELCDGAITLDAQNTDAISYAWNTGAITSQITVTATGTYTVTLEGFCGTFTDQITVVECNDILIQLAAASVVCQGEDTDLEATVSGGTPPYEISWVPELGEGLGPFSVSPDFGQSYTIIVTDAEGETAQESLFIEVIPSELELDLPEFTNLCPGETIRLDATIDGAISYLWSTGAENSILTVGSEGVYTVEVATACALAFAESTVNLSPGFENIGGNRNLLVCEENLPLSIGLPKMDDYGLSWSTGESSYQIDVDAGGIFVADFTSFCTDTTITWDVSLENCDCEIYVPNAFTPNDDALNDSFKPSVNCDLRAYQFTIWNRWGELIFKSTNPTEVWRGESPESDYFGGISVYFWRLEVEQNLRSIVSEPIEKTGRVTVVR